MEDEFAQLVQNIIAPYLSELGFHLVGADCDIDEGGPKATVVYFAAPDCKIQIYHSAREGEMNAMIASVDAPNIYGIRDRSRRWRNLGELAGTPDVPLEELIKIVDLQRDNAQTPSERVEWLKRRIVADIDAARAAIRAPDK